MLTLQSTHAVLQRWFASLPQDLSLVPSTSIWWLTPTCNYSSTGSDALFWPLWELHTRVMSIKHPHLQMEINLRKIISQTSTHHLLCILLASWLMLLKFHYMHLRQCILAHQVKTKGTVGYTYGYKGNWAPEVWTSFLFNIWQNNSP